MLNSLVCFNDFEKMITQTRFDIRVYNRFDAPPMHQGSRLHPTRDQWLATGGEAPCQFFWGATHSSLDQQSFTGTLNPRSHTPVAY